MIRVHEDTAYHDVDADKWERPQVNGGRDGALLLLKGDDPVAVFAPGSWRFAELLPASQGGAASK